MRPAILVNKSLPKIFVDCFADSADACSGHNKLALVTEQYIVAVSPIVNLVVVHRDDSNIVAPEEFIATFLTVANF